MALVTGRALRHVHGTPFSSERNASIDGLRGYLAFFVFIHHAFFWPDYVRTGEWKAPDPLANHFGQIGVMMFFMITAFLFTGKIIRANRQPIDWPKLFIGRILRITPLYFVALLVLALLVAVESGFSLRQDFTGLSDAVLRWLTFTVYGSPDLNGVRNTALIMAGVTWTLAYEWLFYFSLPVIAWVLRRRVGFMALAVSTVLLIAVLSRHQRPLFLAVFISGMLISWVSQSHRFQKFSSSHLASGILIACLASTAIFFQSSYGAMQLLLIATAFALIAGGNSLFGSLTSATSRLIGECAYGIYLLHGFLLYIAYRHVIGMEASANLSAAQHLLVPLAVTPILLGISYLSFRLIETPTMRLVIPATREMRRLRHIYSRRPDGMTSNRRDPS